MDSLAVKSASDYVIKGCNCTDLVLISCFLAFPKFRVFDFEIWEMHSSVGSFLH